MEDRTPVRRIPKSIAAGITAVILATGGTGAWLAWNHSQSPAPQPPTTSQPNSPQAINPNQAQKAQVYWLKDAGKGLEIVAAPLTTQTSSSQQQDLLNSALTSLLEGPNNPSQGSSTIPQGTKLRNLDIKPDGIHVDLSKEFTSGGGSTSMTGRVAQVLYTATSLDPQGKVWLSVEGQPLEVLGGEGLELNQPMTRQEFEQDFDL